MTAKELIEQLSKVKPETEIVGGMWNGSLKTYTVLDELHVFGFDERLLVDGTKLHFLGWTHKIEIEDGVKRLFDCIC